REVEKLLAQRFPKPDVPFSVRTLPAPRAVSPFPEIASPSAPSIASTGSPVTRAAAPVPSPAPRRPVIAPLATDRYEIRFTASGETCEKLGLAQDMLRHAVPTGDVA